jgi:GNAT superfamily N-acetyltransferase
MTVVDGLLDAQSAWFARLDPALPAAVRPPEGDVVTAALPDGARVVGTVVPTAVPAGSLPSLWSAMRVWELHPIIGEAGMAELLAQWRRMMARREPGPDSSCVVTWPSRDARATRALLDHGLVPLSTLGIRTAPPPAPEPVPATVVRRARLRDLDTVLPLAMAELEYSALVGGTVLRPDAERVKREALAQHLDQGDFVWLAERDGIPVALAECWFSDSEPGTWTESRLRHGRWGYVNCVSVAPGARGTGVGQSLMSVVHRELRRAGAAGSFLYYNPPNPLSTVFWARQGYRPLWTIWEARPATALR